MILSELKAHLGRTEPITREFVALMDATFRYYADTRALFFDKIPSHLHQSELISLVNVEIKNRLFDPKFCAGIQDALKSLRRAILRLEDLRALHPEHPDSVNDLSHLCAVAEQVEALYQRHWEFHRYQDRLGEADIVAFLLEIDRVGYAWNIYLSGFSAVHGLASRLSGRACPEDRSPLRITYRRAAPHQFSTGSLTRLLGFLESGYRFICAVCDMDPEQQPLALLQVSVAEPVELQLSVPKQAADAFRRFLHYLFLKDMLKREALLKVVFEAVTREVGREKPLPPALLTKFQKELTAQLKALPEDGSFTISDRRFPEDGIRVLQEFAADLDARGIPYGTLLRTESAKRPKARSGNEKPAARPAGKATDVPHQEPLPDMQGGRRPAASQPAQPRAEGPAGGGEAPPNPNQPRRHIAVLTDR